MRIILLGAPGAGKGTQADSIKAKYPVAHISTGDMLRSNIKEGTELGRNAEVYMDAGKLVPDDVIIAMMERRLMEDDAKEGFMLDGFPRTIAQAKALDEILDKMKLKLDAVVDLVIEDDAVVGRLTSRRVCRQCGEIYNTVMKPSSKEGVCDKCGGDVVQRDDDKEDVIRKRLSVFHEQTAPLIDYYGKQGILVPVDATGEKDAVLKVLEQKKANA
ncbi:adenylate kinase [Cloacibacillus sp. An23]|uniref:adenylate kinase n=1 Tax=Cloacibacillus sp. An23 TaxID=1965591 RepID=UPI000B36713F|nr:adenylate kinase [Cloacibacillus sp. An23]OUO91171.1 adenylate kinase [Cloacibacillus sp. An23]